MVDALWDVTNGTIHKELEIKTVNEINIHGFILITIKSMNVETQRSKSSIT